MTTKEEIQSLLRFLAHDAKIPLPTAMSKVKELQNATLTSPDVLSKTSITTIQSIFPDEKQAKSVLAAAKRASKKRTFDSAPSSSPNKRSKIPTNPLLGDSPTPSSVESSLALPSTTATEDTLASTTLHTNRAPLVLAFAVTLLKYTMPTQPLSSRLSLAQAVVSVNSRSKAVNIGLAEPGTGAEDEGWGAGQPSVRVMGREIRVMRRHGYDPSDNGEGKREEGEEVATQETLKQEDADWEEKGGNKREQEPALWGLDLEALRKANGPLVAGAQRHDGAGLPIYRAEHARAYLLKSFASVEGNGKMESKGSTTKKAAAATQQKQREENLARLLEALNLLYGSWAHVLGTEELDRRAWGWYVAVRPDVKDGVAGWGGKGEVKLSKITDMRRKG